MRKAKPLALRWNTGTCRGDRRAVRHPKGVALRLYGVPDVGSTGGSTDTRNEQLTIEAEAQSWHDWFTALPSTPPRKD